MSDSEDESYELNGYDGISRPVSPSASSVLESRPEPEVEDDSVTCLWDDCGKVYTDLKVFIDHIHNGEYQFAIAHCNKLKHPYRTYWGQQIKLHL